METHCSNRYGDPANERIQVVAVRRPFEDSSKPRFHRQSGSAPESLFGIGYDPVPARRTAAILALLCRSEQSSLAAGERAPTAIGHRRSHRPGKRGWPAAERWRRQRDRSRPLRHWPRQMIYLALCSVPRCRALQQNRRRSEDQRAFVLYARLLGSELLRMTLWQRQEEDGVGGWPLYGYADGVRKSRGSSMGNRVVQLEWKLQDDQSL